MKFSIKSSPHISASDSVPQIMRRVIIALMPAVIYSVVIFGIRVVMLYVVGVLSCMMAETIVKLVRKKPLQLEDCSAVVTGMLLVMTLPPTASAAMVVTGSVIAIVFAKEVFGGLGANVFNPALVGRAFLQLAYPAAMSKYIPTIASPFGIVGRVLDEFSDIASGASTAASSAASGSGPVDMVNVLTQSTPLSFMKYTMAGSLPVSLTDQLRFEGQYYLQMFVGNTSGAIGETSFLLILLGGIFLLATKTINWRIPVSMTVSLSVVSFILMRSNPGYYPSPLFHVLAGGFALGAFFMATDMVTCPSTPLALFVYGSIIGVSLAILRIFGSSPGYMMYAILIGNMFVPLISMFLRPKPLGKIEANALLSANSNTGGNK